MPKYPGFVFYPKDWLSDKRLALCSYATKGAWMDLICYMYQSERCGYLIVEGKILTKENIRRMLKCTDQEFEQIWDELLGNGVMKQHADGTYFSKRMLQELDKISPQETVTKEMMDAANKVIEEFCTLLKDPAPFDKIQASKLIIAQLKTGTTLEDCIDVVHSKFEEWKDEPKFRGYIRPATIFKVNGKFNDYLNEARRKKKSSIPRTSQAKPFNDIEM